jgi:hypothetical protein
VIEADIKLHLEEKNLCVKDRRYQVSKPRKEWTSKKNPDLSARLML